MGLLNALALALALMLGACAVAPPPVSVPPEPSGLRCRFERGTVEGLVLSVHLPAGLPTDAVVVLERDGDAVGQVAVSELPELPFTLRIGDPNVSVGQEARYACVLRRPGELDESLFFAARVAEPPTRPAAPIVTVTDGAVYLDWPGVEAVQVQVLRRDVLVGGDGEAISPWLAEPGWQDAAVEPGRVYAYALHAARELAGVTWYGPLGPERYVEVPEQGAARP